MVQLPFPTFHIVKKKIKDSLRIQRKMYSTLNSAPNQKSSSSTLVHSVLADFPEHFRKGSLIQLATGKTKNVEDLKTADFIESADLCPEVSLEHSTIVRLERIQLSGLFLLSFNVGKNTAEVTISASPEHPFFVYGHGWSSCAPSLTMARYSLNCMQLRVGDVCVSLARNVTNAAEINNSKYMDADHE